MERLNTTEETPVAPHEVREILLRLTEQNTEGIKADEPRTLSGLALETGVPLERLSGMLDTIQGRRKKQSALVPYAAVVAFLALVGWVAFRPPKVQSTAPLIESVQADSTGLVPLNQVTYGLDSGTYMVEPTFDPPHPMMDGVSISITVDNVLWGAGDHHAAVVTKPMTDAQAKKLKEDIIALAEHVRTKSAKRNLAHAKVVGNDPELSFDGSSYTAMLGYRTYFGAGGARFPIPLPGAENDAEAKRLVSRAADRTIAMMQQNLKFEQSAARSSGP